MGLSKIHRLANRNALQELQVNLENFKGNTSYAKYSYFYIGESSTDYNLHVGGYSGIAGNSLTYANNSKFYTRDNDNDDNAANFFHGGWWYDIWWEHRFYISNLNGKYHVEGGFKVDGIFWCTWKTGYDSCKYADMKVRDQV